MKTIIYCIFYLGAIVLGLTTAYMDPVSALVTTLATPIILLQIAQLTGRFRVERAPAPETPLEISTYHAYTDDQALKRFGWSLIVDMDEQIKNTQTQLESMQKSREEMAEMYKKETK